MFLNLYKNINIYILEDLKSFSFIERSYHISIIIPAEKMLVCS